MVSSNTGYPDPDNPAEDLSSPNNEIVMVADTDTEDEENPYNDYVPLPMHEADVPDDSTDENSTGEEASATTTPNDGLPAIVTVEEEVVKEIWSSTSTTPKDIEMDSSKVDEVKQAMLNFTLPPSSIPDWANNIPEEQWKEQLMNRLQDIQKK